MSRRRILRLTLLVALPLAIACGLVMRGPRAADEPRTVAASAPLRMDGEVYARRTIALMPPSIDDVWQFNITQLASDGASVTKGQPVLGFDGGELANRLAAKQSLLNEKRTQLDELVLDLAERARNERLASEEAAANLEKAERKTQQPQALIPGIQYKKLVISRDQAMRKLALMQRREQLAAEERVQERRLLASEVAQLQAEVTQLQQSLGELTLTAPRAGLMMHKSSWSGEKFDVGSQVWRGQAVAEIPDTTSLAVRAELPERDYARVHAGQAVRVEVEGGAGAAFRGRVASIGRTVRSKSRVQPVPILDVDIDLVAGRRLKPGQPVSVELASGATGGRR